MQHDHVDSRDNPRIKSGDGHDAMNARPGVCPGYADALQHAAGAWVFVGGPCAGFARLDSSALLSQATRRLPLTPVGVPKSSAAAPARPRRPGSCGTRPASRGSRR